MKKTILLSGILLYCLISCDSSSVVQTKLPSTTNPEMAASTMKPEMEEKIVAHSEIQLASPQISRTSHLTDEDLELVKSSSLLMDATLTVDFEDIQNGIYQLMPDTFFEKYIHRLPVKASFEETIPREAHEPIYFHSIKETDDFLLFSILQTNGYCCIMQYGITVDKADHKIIDAALMTITGGDGGWYRKDTGLWINDSTLAISTIEEEYEDIEDESVQQITDSVQTQLLLTSKGLWSKVSIDSLRVIDTVSVF